MLSRRCFLWSAAGLSCLPLSCGAPPDEVTLQGSGATFPAPIYKRWFLEIYRRDPNLRINYQAIGSGAGIRQFIEGLTEFGASDAAMSDKELARFDKEQPESGGVLMVPLTAGSVVLAYKVPALDQAGKVLLLTRGNLVDILFGDITRWNDPRLVKLNPDLADVDRPITWVRRSEGSGTTYAFTNHLSAVSKRWKDEIGTHKSVAWPVGIGAKGNDGVAAIISQTPGAIGYVEFGFARLSNLPFAAYQNKAGQFVQPKRVYPNNPLLADETDGKAALTPDQIALASAELPANFRLFIPDPARDNAYPLVTYTWLLVARQYRNEKVAGGVREMLEWCLTEGQKISDDLAYIPLPEVVSKRILVEVR
jgi:phosphate transport system substrate-binding protein